MSILAVVTCGVGGILYLGVFAVNILYVVIATVKANEGLIYEYPMTSRFVNVPMDEGYSAPPAPSSEAPPPPQPPEE